MVLKDLDYAPSELRSEPDQIELVSGDAESRALADSLKAILAKG